MIIFDENIDRQIIEKIRAAGYKTYAIREETPGISDREVIDIVRIKKGLLITEDKDFGELVFSHNIKNCSVMLLRYKKSDSDQVTEKIIRVLKNYYKDSANYFYTISGDRIRSRKI
ncbi:MAG TPA: DUF5615 family PIN-like protein [Balneolaceae bacterium]|nr:DUF5615 family PIN-like protein [Balneolaceae bacterium]